MSKVYSFRLDENNPREAQAREVIDAWVSNGYSVRHVITGALLTLGNKGDHEDYLFELLNQIKDLLLEREASIKVEEVAPKSQILSSSFVESLKLSVKPGQREEKPN